MRKLPVFAFASVAAVALAGSAFAAAPKTHKMDVALPDGSVAHIEYVGEIAPKVTIAPRALADAPSPWMTAFPSFAGFDRMIQEMNRQSQEMLSRARQIAQQSNRAAPYVASYGNLAPGETSTTVVSVSNNGSTCTRTTQMVSQGAGKAPKIISNVTGQCGSSPESSSRPANPA